MGKKPTISNISSGYASTTTLNNNFTALRDGFDNTLSLDGSTPNSMNADFDVNGYRILNAGQIDTDALYLGGVAITSSADVEFQTTYLTASYTGDGSTVAYNLTANPQSEGNVSIYVDGVYQNKNTFSLSGTTVTFSEAPPLNSAIEIVYPTNTDTLNGSVASAITYNQGGTGAQDRTVQSKLQDTVSVKDFGAVGDGVADDTAAIQAAISSRKSGKILVPQSASYDYGLLNAGSVYVNDADIATIGSDEKLTNGTFTGSATGWALSNFAYSANSITHSTGTTATAIQTVAIKPWTNYMLTIDVSTSTYGRVDVVIDGVSYIFESGGLPYDVGNSTHSFNLLTGNVTGNVDFSISADADWGGSINSVSFVEIAAPFQPIDVYAANDDTDLNLPSGIKFGRKNAGNIGIGDKQTLTSIEYGAAWNVALGARALSSVTDAIENTAIGSFALQFTNTSRQTAVGYAALKANTSGLNNTGIGFKSLTLATTGRDNTALGFHSSLLNVNGNNNTSLGSQAAYSNINGSGNTSVGKHAGLNNDGGDANTYIGTSAGELDANPAVTFSYDATTSVGSGTKVFGDYSIAIGANATAGTSGSPLANASISIGSLSSVGVSASVLVGHNSSITGTQSVGVGYEVEVTGQQGTAVGYLADAKGYRNTALGSQAGVGFTGQLNTFIGATAGLQTVAYENCTLLGSNTAVTGDNQVQLGDSATTTYAYGAVQNRSDERDKADIRDTQLGLDFVKKLRPVDYKWDYREAYREVDENGNVIEHEKNGSRKRNRYHHGLIAQDVAQVINELGLDFGGYQDHSINGGDDVKSIGYVELIAPLIKAVQELSAKVDEQAAEISALKGA